MVHNATLERTPRMPMDPHYPFDAIPAHGEPREVADGVYWLRMPLPFSLDHINLYLLRDGAGWSIVDTGIRGPETLAHWERVLRDFFAGAPVTRVIATHMHPDHVGQAGWLTRHCKVELWMTRTEFLTCKVLAGDGPADVPEDALRFYRQCGFDDHQIDIYTQRFGRFGAMIERLPAGYRRLRDAQVLGIDGTAWQVVVGRGHSPEHACLYCADKQVLISGDQVLPRISSNVSVFPTEPLADPLREFLAACDEIGARVPDEVLVLPSHNEPFTGLHARLRALVQGHHEGLARLHALCAQPMRVVDVFPALFRRTIDAGNLLLATGESRAHLNYLQARGVLAASLHPDGALHFEQCAAYEPTASTDPETLP
jgi:glyoxylase-like metal-dependent hydrolase (beta-lactamase superfamily II)